MLRFFPVPIAKLLASASLLVPASASGQQLPSFLAGDLTFRGDAWPVELTLAEGAGGERERRALLTLPDLVYADQPAETRREPDGVVLTFPFGLVRPGRIAPGATHFGRASRRHIFAQTARGRRAPRRHGRLEPGWLDSAPGGR